METQVKPPHGEEMRANSVLPSSLEGAAQHFGGLLHPHGHCCWALEDQACSCGAGEGAGAGEVSGGRAGAPGRAEEAALRLGWRLRCGRGWGGPASTSPQEGHPQEASPGPETWPRPGAGQRGRDIRRGGIRGWGHVCALIFGFVPSRCSLSKTPACTGRTPWTSSGTEGTELGPSLGVGAATATLLCLCFKQIALPLHWCAFVRGGLLPAWPEKLDFFF